MARAFFFEAQTYHSFLRVLTNPNLTTNSNPTTTPSGTTSISKSHSGRTTVVGCVIGGVTALLAIGSIALAVWHRRRRSHRRTPPSVGSLFFRDDTDQSTQVTVTPFSLTGLAPTVAAPLVAGLAHRPSSPQDPLRHVASFPVGLSGKELARLRSNGLRPRPMDGRPPTPPSTTTEGGDALEGAVAAATGSSGAQRLRLEILRDEPGIQQLPAERSESPPSYASRPWTSNI